MRRLMYATTALLIIAGLSSCMKDSCEKYRGYTFYQPIYKKASEVRANIKSKPPLPIVEPGKLFIQGNYIFLNEKDKGIHIIDNRNPASPVNISFVDIPGNLDLAVQGNKLYADFYTTLVTLDITNPLDIKAVKFDDGVFPRRNYGYGFVPDSDLIITSWIRRDTMIKESCSQPVIWYNSYMDYAVSTNSSVKSSSPVGKGGSMARFALAKNYLYTVSNSDLSVFNLTPELLPEFSNTVHLNNWSIETIFPLKDKLFIGSSTGMYVFNIQDPATPVKEGEFFHVQSCDPVIADDTYAYVTLRSGNSCGGTTNQLDILKLNDITNPSLVRSYPFKNPRGLSKDGDLLFICDGDDGLKIFDASDVTNLKLIKQIKLTGTYDVIADNGKALVVAKDGLYQYSYSDLNKIYLLHAMTY
ncbi:MAG: hypothetical protein J0H55_04055 [Chitinophagaceae bacterium]|nr:hypothetical protein [Chitinophagaceae bacterium]